MLDKEDKSSDRLDEIKGTLWCHWADYHVRDGPFELARSVHEEALDRVTTVRDFSAVFDAYATFKERTAAATLELLKDEEENAMFSRSKNTEEEEERSRNDELQEDGYDLDLVILFNRELQGDDDDDAELASSAAVQLRAAATEPPTTCASGFAGRSCSKTIPAPQLRR